jgi:hypothetical protein
MYPLLVKNAAPSRKRESEFTRKASVCVTRVSERCIHLPFQGHRKQMPPAPNGIVRIATQVFITERLKTLEESGTNGEFQTVFMCSRTSGRPQRRFTGSACQCLQTNGNENSLPVAGRTMPIEREKTHALAYWHALPTIFNRDGKRVRRCKAQWRRSPGAATQHLCSSRADRSRYPCDAGKMFVPTKSGTG